MSASLVDVLQGAADCAAEAETAVRRESERRISALARSFVFRNLVRAVVAAVAGAETEDTVPALADAVLCREFGWSGGNDSVYVGGEKLVDRLSFTRTDSVNVDREVEVGLTASV